ncbi:3'-5' exonuclease [Candidatus Gracilibacteria bacterium]|nr:3'-5' exonuclease [Candidatus Gracilibacteria bacterium]
MNLIHLDLETTGLDETARIIQLAYKNTETGEVVNEFFNPQIPISFGAMATHHITNEMVADKPAFEGSKEKADLITLLKDNILVAHNAPFDIGILKIEGVEVPTFIDTLKVAQHLIKSENHKLQYLRYSLGLTVEGPAHDALGDIQVLEGLYAKLESLAMEEFTLTTKVEVVSKFLELTQLPVLLGAFTFGKHRGKDFKEIAVSDRGYLEWLQRSETQKLEPEQNRNLVHTLNHYLA